MKKISGAKILKFLFIFLFILVLCRASLFRQINPFGISVSFAMLAQNFDPLIIIFSYVASNILLRFSISNIIIILVEICSMILLSIINNKRKKKLPVYIISLFILFSQSARIYFGSGYLEEFLAVITSVFISFVSFYIFNISVSSFIKRGRIFKFTIDEKICHAMLIMAFFSGLSGLYFGNFILTNTLCLMVLFFISRVSLPSFSICFSTIAGLGVSLSSGSIVPLAIFSVWSTMLITFKSNKKIITSLMVIAADVVVGVFLNIYGIYDLWVLLSTIVGGYVLWMFVTMMIDIAYRSIKFIALELLSPIAIVSYIDPSSGKKGLFSKWMNETVKTYISLFIRIFVFALCSVLLRAFSLSNFDMSEKGFVKLFYVLAIIAFIKNAPKFIDGLFGTSISKDSDTKFVSDMFRGVLGGVATLAGGAITGAHVAGKVGESRLKGAWKGATSNWKKGYDTAKKGGLGALPGVVSAATYGAYTGAKKQYGYENDKEMQKLIDSLERKVPAIDEAKSGAVDELMANDREKYNQILEKGTKVNGRKYGRGLEKDDALENMLKKNAGGLAKDEVLHAGDNEYLERRRFVADRKQAEAIMSRTNAIAKAQYSSAVDAYNSSNDKNAYLISFEMGTAKNDFGRMDESGLKDAVTNELQKFIQTGRLQFNNADMSGKMDLVIENTNLDRAVVQNMSETELKVEYDKAIIEKANNSLSKFESADSIEAKTSIALDIKRDNITYEISGLSGANLTDRFNDANDARIVSNFGHSLDNIEADATKVSGEVKDAQAALDEYLKSGNGKKAKRLDSAYSLADSAYKAKKLAREQREEAARNNANNNNNNN